MKQCRSFECGMKYSVLWLKAATILKSHRRLFSAGGRQRYSSKEAILFLKAIILVKPEQMVTIYGQHLISYTDEIRPKLASANTEFALHMLVIIGFLTIQKEGTWRSGCPGRPWSGSAPLLGFRRWPHFDKSMLIVRSLSTWNEFILLDKVKSICLSQKISNTSWR